MVLKDEGCSGVVWINLAQDRVQCLAVVNAVMEFRVVKGGGA
jgi:hypothetical protein